MRVRATGGLGKAFAAVGAVPTSVTSPEAYQAMESGVVDTVAFAQHAHLSLARSTKPIGGRQTSTPGTVNCPVVVNIDAYESCRMRIVTRWIARFLRRLSHISANYGELAGVGIAVLARKGVEKVEIAPK